MTYKKSDVVQQPFADCDRAESRLDANGESVERRAEGLMPLETVAKTIFVKSHGLAAYQAATGMSRRCTDIG